MTKRKTVGWLVFSALVLVIASQLPCIASRGFYVIGSRFYAAGNYHAAAVAFSGSVLLERRFARAHLELGTTYFALKKYEQAEKAFLKARRIEDDSCASCGLGMTYHALGRDDDAEKAFKRAMSLNDRDVCAYEQSGRMYYDLGKYQEAIGAFKRVVATRPTSNTYIFLGNAYVYAREFESGVDAYKESIRLDPGCARSPLQLGIAYDYLDRPEEAAAAFKEAIKLDPDDETAHYYLAMDYLALHNRPAALAEYEILRKIDPDGVPDNFEDFALSQNRERSKEKLYFIPLNNFPTTSLNRLVTFYKQKPGIEAITTESLPLRLAAIDNRRQQLIAEEVIELMKRSYPKLVADPNAILIGLTDEDMYIRDKDWQYAFSYWTHGRFAVVSSARMNPVNFGSPANNDLLDRRLRKMVLKNIGVLYYQLPANHDPKSVLYNDIKSVRDLDNMGEDF
jgi:tetratricopeptide (TPR) repeat protein